MFANNQSYSCGWEVHGFNNEYPSTTHIKNIAAAYIKNAYTFLTDSQIDDILSWVADSRLQYLYEQGNMLELEKNVPNRYKIIKEEEAADECRAKIKEHEERIAKLKALL